MSLVVLHSGQRKKIKINPTTSTVQAIVDDAARAFQLNPLHCDLQHNRRSMDKAQLFKFSGISNNATVELILSNKSIGNSEVKIALTAEDLGSRTASFRSDQTLHDMLVGFMDNGFLPADILQRSPVVVYLRQQFFAEQLDSPFQSLGLGSGGARLQLRFDQSVVSSHEESHLQKVNDSISEVIPQEMVFSPSEAVPAATAPDAPICVAPASPLSDDLAIPNSESTDVQLPSVEATVSLCHRMLNSNFDCVSIPAVITITKYLDNLIKNPAITKYRSINTQNAIFAENVGPAKGALEVLISIGFLPQLPRYLQSPHLHPPSTASAAAAPKLYFQFEKILEEKEALPSSSAHQLTFMSISLLRSIREQALVAMMDELDVPLEKRPLPPVPPSERPQQSVAAIPLVPFDPFKPLIIRNLNQVLLPPPPSPPSPCSFLPLTPPLYQPRAMTLSTEATSRDGAVIVPAATEHQSETEIKLNKLLKKRDELMGDRGAVARNTKVSLATPPRQGLDDADPKAMGSEDVMDVEQSDGSDSMAMKAMMRKYARSMRTADGEDNTPLTTRAIRDLEKVQREVVYAQTLIKVRLPDRICLEAYFHPQDTVEDIYRWLSDSCFLSTEDYLHQAISFELYITPPRLVLPTEVSLQELKLVPAAVLYLSWKTTPQRTNPSEDALPGYGYLKSHLYRTANSLNASLEASAPPNESLGDSHFSESANHFPRGQKLIKGEQDIREAGSGSAGGDNDSDSMSKDRKPSGGTASGTKKPRWLKT